MDITNKKVTKSKKGDKCNDKYNGFKVQPKSKRCGNWTNYIYDIIKEAKCELLDNSNVKDAFNELVTCVLKYEGALTNWYPGDWHRYSINDSVYKFYGDEYTNVLGYPGTWWNSNILDERENIRISIKEIMDKYYVLYELIKTDIVPYMKKKNIEVNNNIKLEQIYKKMSKIEGKINKYEKLIESERKALTELAQEVLQINQNSV
jgi:hypothetical protein